MKQIIGEILPFATASSLIVYTLWANCVDIISPIVCTLIIILFLAANFSQSRHIFWLKDSIKNYKAICDSYELIIKDFKKLFDLNTKEK